MVGKFAHGAIDSMVLGNKPIRQAGMNVDRGSDLTDLNYPRQCRFAPCCIKIAERRLNRRAPRNEEDDAQKDRYWMSRNGEETLVAN